jgi:ABC-type nitrate/sulfonate/bicarbonate transport system substrate-binding protein
MRAYLIFFTVLLLILTACQPIASPVIQAEIAEPTTPRSMTFMAGYKPQANLPFVGVYIAQEKGYFAAENLDVIIEHSPGQGQHLQMVATGKVHVTTQDAAVLLKRRADPGLPLVSIALIGQHGQQAFAALASSGMKTPVDWEGRLVGYKGTPPPDLFALLGRAGADVNKMQLVNVGFDPRLLAEGMVDVYPVFKSNEPYMLKSWGYEVILWEAADFGVPALGLAYVTSDETLQTHSEELKRFLRAVLKGIEYAADYPEEAVDIVLQYTGPETSREHMRFMLDSELPERESEVTQVYGTGWQTEAQWQALADMLIEFDAMPPVEVSQVFTTQILEAIREK